MEIHIITESCDDMDHILKGLTNKDTEVVNPIHTWVLKWMPIYPFNLPIIWVIIFLWGKFITPDHHWASSWS